MPGTRKLVELPDEWELHADSEGKPWLLHARGGGQRLEPKDFPTEYDARAIYRALKLEEDRRSRLYHGVERDPDWLCIWSARVVIGDFMSRKITGDDKSDEILNEEVDGLVRKEQEERAKLWLN